ncbi:MAG: response regulator [bacterium]
MTPSEDIPKYLPEDSLSGPFTILVAEDDEMNFSYIEIILRRYGYNIIHANNGFEAVEICKENPTIDLVLMDMMMPIMNGHEATYYIHQLRPDLPIIAQTAYLSNEITEKALLNGCIDSLEKPYKENELIAIVRKYLPKKNS